MRVMLKAKMPVESGNKAIKDGSLPKILASVFEQVKPEAVYFGAECGMRTAYVVFDMKDTSQIPSVAEPLFMALNASIEFIPVMNQDDLKKGLELAAKNR
jgi:hypothetical protein